jgi:hypothetical protein
MRRPAYIEQAGTLSTLFFPLFALLEGILKELQRKFAE